MNVPDGWRVATLGEVLSPETRREVPTKALPYIGMEHVASQTGRVSELGNSESIRSTSPLVDEGDVLYGRLRPYLNKVALAPRPAYVSGEFIVLRGNDQVDAHWLKWRLTSEDFVRFATSLNAGDRPRVKWPQMAQFSALLPPLSEQRRIVERLEEHLAHLDAADTSLAQAEQRLIALQEGVIRFAVSGGGEERVVSPDTLSRAGTADGELPHLPRGWSWARLGDIADVVGGVTKDSKKQADPTYVAAPYLRVANVQRGHLNLDSVTTIRVPPKKLEALRLQPDDVLLNEGGDRDKLARGWVWDGQIDDCIHQNHVFRARIRDNLIDARFLSHTANALGGKWADRNGKQTTNLASISLSMIRKMPIIIPPANTSNQIADQLADRLDNLDRQRTAIRAQQHRSTVLRRAVLAAAFAGRLTGASSDSDLIEEVAS